MFSGREVVFSTQKSIQPREVSILSLAELMSPVRCTGTGCLQTPSEFMLRAVINLDLPAYFSWSKHQEGLSSLMPLWPIPFSAFRHLSITHCLSTLMSINEGNDLCATCLVWRGVWHLWSPLTGGRDDFCARQLIGVETHHLALQRGAQVRMPKASTSLCPPGPSWSFKVANI